MCIYGPRAFIIDHIYASAVRSKQHVPIRSLAHCEGLRVFYTVFLAVGLYHLTVSDDTQPAGVSDHERSAFGLVHRPDMLRQQPVLLCIYGSSPALVVTH